MNEKKFVLVTEGKKTINDVLVLYRVKAEKDFVTCDGRRIKKGHLGGFVEKEENLSQSGLAWIDDNACVYGEAEVSGNALVAGRADISNNAKVKGHAQVVDSAVVYGHAIVDESSFVYGECRIGGRFNISGHARIGGKARLVGSGTGRIESNAQIFGHAKIYSAFHVRVSGDAEIYDFARINGGCKICEDAKVHGKTRIVGNEITIRGLAEVCGETEIQHGVTISEAAYICGGEEAKVVITGSSNVSGHAHIAQPSDFRFVFTNGMNITFYKEAGKSRQIGVYFVDERGVVEQLSIEELATRHKRNAILLSEIHLAKHSMNYKTKRRK